MGKVLIVGAGHNGLVAAFYLLRMGHEVTILERAAFIGGACAGFRRPCGCIFHAGASHFGMLHDKVFRDLRAAGVSLASIAPAAQTLVPFSGRPPIVLHDDLHETMKTIAAHHSIDAEGYRRFSEELSLAIRSYAPFREKPNSTLNEFIASLEQHGVDFPRLFATGSVADTLKHYFIDDGVRGALASSMLLYNASTQQPGSALSFPYYGQMMVEGAPGWRMLVGGMSHFTNVLADVVAGMGGTIVVDAGVERFESAENNISSAIDVRGRHYTADLYVAACDPWHVGELLKRGGHSSAAWSTLEQLWLRPSFTGMCGKANFLLKEVPRFHNIPEGLQRVARRTLVSNLTSLQMMDDAFETAERNGFSDVPYVEILIPTEIDPSQGCGGHTIMSVYFMYSVHESGTCAPYDHAMVREKLIAELNMMIDKFSDIVLDEQILSNTDLSELYGFARGNVDHGSLALDYCFNQRGLPGYQPPTTDMTNLILASAGSAPGGLVSGIPGWIASQMASERL